MDADEIRRLLIAVGARLHAEGVIGELYVVGGAAIALAYDARRSTQDVDAVFEPKMAVYRAAAAVAEAEGLPPAWLNDAVKGFLAGPDPAAQPVLDVPGLRCAVASPRILLAMKVLAHRTDEDEDDVRLLAGILGLHDADAVLDVAEAVYGDRLTIRAELFVRAVLNDA